MSYSELAIEAILEEFRVLREEISLYHKQQKELVNFALVLTIGIFSVLLPGVTRIREYPSLLLLFPHLFSLLGLMYADRTLRILRIADYIYNIQRPVLEKLAGTRVWYWEDYKRNTRLFNRRFARFLDGIRWFVFLIPPIFVFIGFIFFKTGMHWTKIEILFFTTAIALFVLNLVSILILEESSGIKEATITLEGDSNEPSGNSP